MKMQTEYPSDYTRICCLDEDCTWCGDITELEVWEATTGGQMVCVCPDCLEIVFEQFDPVLKSPVKTSGDKNNAVQTTGHPT